MHTQASPAKGSQADTILEAILRAERLLKESGATDTPRLDAEVLLADLLGISRSKLIALYPNRLSRDSRDSFFSRVERRTRSEPVAYIIGRKEFMDYTFRVDRRALIPRPETETLVEHAVELTQRNKFKHPRILDVGTGSGCIAVSLALLLPNAEIHAIDVSEPALELARENAQSHHVEKRITFHLGHAYSELPESLKNSFNLIVANPPYVPDGTYPALPKVIREYEPASALLGGPDGLDVARAIAAGAPCFLAPAGILVLEIGEDQASKAAEILHANRLEVEEVVRDLAGRQRVITGRKKT
ncbi:MAG: peptide chain release factor N(5)-glutamine methyltransferase [Candidatus Abyssubacteria bacterium]